MFQTFELQQIEYLLFLLFLDTRFKQQQLAAWQPMLTARSVLPFLVAIGVAFIPIGIALFLSASNVRIADSLGGFWRAFLISLICCIDRSFDWLIDWLRE